MILEGIKNFLQLINDNWTLLLTIFALIYTIYRKVTAVMKMTKAEKEKMSQELLQTEVNAALEQIHQILLKSVSDAEKTHADEKGVGALKRSEVLQEIYRDYTILSKIPNQASVTATLDELIDKNLATMNELALNSETFQKCINFCIETQDSEAK